MADKAKKVQPKAPRLPKGQGEDRRAERVNHTKFAHKKTGKV